MITLARSLQSELFLRTPPRGRYLERIQRALFFGRRVDPDVTASLDFANKPLICLTYGLLPSITFERLSK
jgi:hypothetical protein